MTRIKRGTAAKKRKRKLLKQTKGYKLRRKSSIKLATQARLKAGEEAYVGRKKKKGDFRRLWIIRMNAALRQHGTTYSTFTGMMKKQDIIVNRKVLSELAATEPAIFEKLVKEVLATNESATKTDTAKKAAPKSPVKATPAKKTDAKPKPKKASK